MGSKLYAASVVNDVRSNLSRILITVSTPNQCVCAIFFTEIVRLVMYSCYTDHKASKPNNKMKNIAIGLVSSQPCDMSK